MTKKNWKLRSKKVKVYAFMLLGVFVFDILFPSVSFALTSGPSQPEFTSFEPISTTHMVDEFTGDFTYSLPLIHIPGPNNSGYSMSLAYHSGVNVESEASWVGHGWTLNPGAINRMKSGIPDDWNGVTTQMYSKAPANKTLTVGGATNFEGFSSGVGFSKSLRYNNYKGFATSASFSMNFGGVVSLGYNLSSDADGSFDLGVNPMGILSAIRKIAAAIASKGKGSKEETEKSSSTVSKALNKIFNDGNSVTSVIARSGLKSISKAVLSAGRFNIAGGNHGLLSRKHTMLPFNVAPATGSTKYYKTGMNGTFMFLDLGVGGDVFGSLSVRNTVDKMDMAAYGQMHLIQPGGDNTILDYSTERLDPYKKRDYYLPIPFSNKDIYSVTGEGLAGAFQIQHKKVGYYGPNMTMSNLDISGTGLEVDAGWYNGVGASGQGGGTHSLMGGPWQPLNSNGWESSTSTSDEPYHFRFLNDLGGSIIMDQGNTDERRATLYDENPSDNNVYYEAKIPSGIQNVSPISWNETGADRLTRSHYIGYHTNGEIAADDDAKYFKEDLDEYGNNIYLLDRGHEKVSTQIGEFAMYSESGERYTYGLPVYNSHEASISVGLGGSSGNVTVDENNHLAYINGGTDIHPENYYNHNMYNGSYTKHPYASSYLLTSIVQPDYIDLTDNGPTEDDFGGYTKFEYERLYPSGIVNYNDVNTWYKWRIPYNGMTYNKNQLSDSRDDMGGVNFGYKQIYYLSRIETKTHYAEFITLDRNDGHEAIHDESDATSLTENVGEKSLKKLDEVRIFKKSSNGQDDVLIKRIKFEYSYSLCKGVLNNPIDPNDPNLQEESGKLTLDKIFVETGGVYNAKIAPYEFKYNYPENTEIYSSLYEGLAMNSNLIQNPNYNPSNIDPWGNYQLDGGSRLADMKNWVNQNPSSEFDPAAWHLKQIILPSGGEIHIQYEQDDYQHVQDQRAHMMVPLAPDPLSNHLPNSATHPLNSITIDLSTINPNLSDEEYENIIKTTSNLYAGKSRRMYFKFLYQLLPDGNPTQVEVNDCNTEYINGYFRVHSVLGNNYPEITIICDPGDQPLHSIPKHVCVDYVKKERFGMIPGQDGDCDAGGDMFEGSLSSSVMSLLQHGMPTPQPIICPVLNPSLSYLRIPVGFQKLGGGVRVKRLLTYDPGDVVDNVNGSLYGDEYYYKKKDEDGNIVSSGVATNEPHGIREENVLVSFIKTFDSQNKLDKIISGRDLRQAEGPIGESILPEPSVGYSKVIRKSIHSGKTDAGYNESDYFTAYSHPLKVSFSKVPPTYKPNYKYKPYGVLNKLTNETWTTQGFRFWLNDMHGKLNMSTDYINPNLNNTYSGECDYSDFLSIALKCNSERVVKSFVKNEYYDFEKENLKVIHDVDIENEEFFNVSEMKPGRDMDITIESRFTFETLNQSLHEFDAGFSMLGPIPVISGSYMPSITKNRISIYSNVITKVISDPTILKKNIVYNNYNYTLTEHTHFSAQSGVPVITRTHDGYRRHNVSHPDQLLTMLEFDYDHQGIYKNFNVPTLLSHENFNQTALNEGLKIKTEGNDYEIILGSTQGNYYLEFDFGNSVSVSNACGILNNFTAGDKVLVAGSNDDWIFHIADIHSNRLWLESTFTNDALPSGSMNISSMKVLRSGRKNRLTDVNFNFRTYTDQWPSNLTQGQQIETYTVQDPEMAAYQQFVDDLNGVISGGSPIIIPGHTIPENLGLYNSETGECLTAPFDNIEIKISNPQFSSSNYLLVEVMNLNQVIVGSPGAGQQHPMVDALNNYINTYYGQGQGYTSLTTADETCNYGNFMTNFIYNGTQSPPILNDMRIEQQDYLNNLTFNDVNGQNDVSISDFFFDDGHGTNAKSSIFVSNNLSPSNAINMRVVLVDNISGFEFGRTADCNDDQATFCAAACSFQDNCVPFESSHFNPQNHFYQDAEGYLNYYYKGFDENGGISKESCRTDIRFYRLVQSNSDFYNDHGKGCIFHFPANSEFRLNQNTGQIELWNIDLPCAPYPVDCIQFCQGLYPPLWVKNVVESEVKTYSDQWQTSTVLPTGMDEVIYDYGHYELGRRGKWREKGSYVFNTDIKGIDGADYTGVVGGWEPRSYNTGTYDMAMFNFAIGALNHPQWLKINTILKYNQDGIAIEEQNILGTKSTALMGYDQSLPYLIAKNASHTSVLFESFEKQYTTANQTAFEQDVQMPVGAQWVHKEHAHLGNGALDISDLEEPLMLKAVPNWWQHYPDGLKVKFWFRSSHFETPLKYMTFNLGTSSIPVVAKSLQLVGKSGEWMLAEAIISSNDITQAINSTAPIHLSLNYTPPTYAHTMVIDDVLIQPLFSEVQAYVYDINDFKLKASLDDQHYAMIFQYNTEGKLVRKNKETERGTKVLKETQYNVPLKTKYP